MKTRLILVFIFGIVGTGVLLALGTWQVKRLAWKEAILAEISTSIAAAPVAVPPNPDRTTDRFLPVHAEGALTGEELIVMSSRKQVGAGLRVISVMETSDGRRILLDRGFVPMAKSKTARPPQDAISVTGNLHWPDEVDGFTPDPDRATGMWFARDVDAMSKKLNTEPVMIIARALSPQAPEIDPLPVSTDGIANDHLGYATTWFSLAVIWVVMTSVLMWRIWRRTE